MKRFCTTLVLLTMMLTLASAQSTAEIKFDQTVINVGTFPESDPVKKVVFTFTNVGKEPLVINQVIASCGCTTTKYDKKPIGAGQKGTIEVTYNGKGKFDGHFKKSITVRTNGKVELTRLYIEGDMTK